jgi:hypothetical protein
LLDGRLRNDAIRGLEHEIADVALFTVRRHVLRIRREPLVQIAVGFQEQQGPRAMTAGRCNGCRGMPRNAEATHDIRRDAVVDRVRIAGIAVGLFEEPGTRQ